MAYIDTVVAESTTAARAVAKAVADGRTLGADKATET